MKYMELCFLVANGTVLRIMFVLFLLLFIYFILLLKSWVMLIGQYTIGIYSGINFNLINHVIFHKKNRGDHYA